MKTQFMKFTLAAGFALALAFTFSCSGGDDDDDGGGGSSSSDGAGGSSSSNGGDSGGGGSSSSNGGDGGGGGSSSSNGGDSGGGSSSGEAVEVSGTFEYMGEDSHEYCGENGILETFPDTQTMNYSISSGILSAYVWNPEDTINFRGTSSGLTGTWTRTKNANASCKPSDKDEGYKRCKDGYDITKMVFENSTVKITRDYCVTDEYIEGSAMGGGTFRIIDCDTYELHNGMDIIRFKETKTSGEISYKGITCGFDESEFTTAQKEAACREAWDTRDPGEIWGGGSYDGILREDFFTCFASIEFPEWFEISGGGEEVDVGGGGKGNDIANYRTVPIGTQTWMAENLDYAVEGSKCYDDSVDNCIKYGRLYDWETAKTVCPDGWHLPTDEEWETLTEYVESDKNCEFCTAEHLRAKSGWDDDHNGLDSYDFSALPGGAYYPGSPSYFSYAGKAGYWWSASESVGGGGILRESSSYNANVSWASNNKSYLFSVRCVKD